MHALNISFYEFDQMAQRGSDNPSKQQYNPVIQHSAV